MYRVLRASPVLVVPCHAAHMEQLGMEHTLYSQYTPATALEGRKTKLSHAATTAQLPQQLPRELPMALRQASPRETTGCACNDNFGQQGRLGAQRQKGSQGHERDVSMTRCSPMVPACAGLLPTVAWYRPVSRTPVLRYVPGYLSQPGLVARYECQGVGRGNK